MINGDLLFAFEKYLTNIERMKPASIRRYLGVIMEFRDYQAENAQDRHLRSIREPDLNTYLARCRRRGNGNQRQRFKVSALQTFFRFLLQAGFIENDPSSDIKRPEVCNDIVHFFYREEILCMFETIDISSKKGLRDAAFLTLGAFAGLRVAEIGGLNVDQISDDGECVALRIVKSSNGNRSVDLWPAPSGILRELLRVRLRDGAKKGDPLLVSAWKNGVTRGNRMNGKTLDKLLKAIAYRAGIEKVIISTHMLRAAHVRDLQLCGFDVAAIMKRLGWVRMDSIERYFYLAGETSQKYASLSEYWNDFPKLWIKYPGASL